MSPAKQKFRKKLNSCENQNREKKGNIKEVLQLPSGNLKTTNVARLRIQLLIVYGCGTNNMKTENATNKW